MPVVPFLKSPLTDLTGVVATNQTYGLCREIEMKLINCFEAYGAKRGEKLCANYLSDFDECFNQEKQTKRLYAMNKERNRQYKEGKSLDELYIPPPREDAVP
uniref:NADH ubiquinone oxidoreductase n=1 Tax=Riptortus pedestris TaxID=329032 RepID=R4WDA5_RIPPE|nr:NADH ubiquinone oxidoreductase [Riptortus pedestris]